MTVVCGQMKKPISLSGTDVLLLLIYRGKAISLCILHADDISLYSTAKFTITRL